AIECPMLILDGTIRAHEKWVHANIVTASASVLRAAGLVACVRLGYGLVQMGFVILTITIITLILMSIIFVRLCPAINLHPKRIRRAQLRSLLKFGMFTTIIAIVYTLRFQGHNLIIGKMISLEAVGIYGVAGLLIKNMRAVVVAPNRVFGPRFAYLDGGNKHKRVASLFLRGTKINAIFSSSLTLIVLVVGPAFMSIWVGDTFKSVYPALMVLALGILVETSLTVTGPLLAATGHQRAQAIISLIEGCIGFGLSILLAWRLGLTGIAMGFLISVALMRGVVCPLYICRLHRMSVVRYYLDALSRPWLIMFMLVAAAHYIRIASYIQTWTSLAVVITILLTVYSACIYTVAISAETRKVIHLQISRLFLSLAAKVRNSN
ncbi:MAG: lipopolysaccharide biosynthesis protein, partial [Planctomycetota bacterium]